MPTCSCRLSRAPQGWTGSPAARGTSRPGPVGCDRPQYPRETPVGWPACPALRRWGRSRLVPRMGYGHYVSSVALRQAFPIRDTAPVVAGFHPGQPGVSQP